MDWLKRNPRLGFVLLLTVAVLSLEGWSWSRNHRRARRALATLEEKKQERDRLTRQTPSLSRENEEAIVRDLADTGRVRAALQAALQEAGAPAAPAARAGDLFFDLASFAEEIRARAAQAGVTVKPDEHFGFATHRHEGPGSDLIPAVGRQRASVQYLVGALLAAQPRTLVAVQRERPLTAAQRARRHQVPPPETTSAGPAAAGGAPEDFFDFDAALSVRVPGLVDSDAFRLEFTGQTPALRAFLNTLTLSRLPVIVRSVEVEPLAAGRTGANPEGSAADGAPVPLVAQNPSKFAVVVECVRLVPAPGESTP